MDQNQKILQKISGAKFYSVQHQGPGYTIRQHRPISVELAREIQIYFNEIATRKSDG